MACSPRGRFWLPLILDEFAKGRISEAHIVPKAPGVREGISGWTNFHEIVINPIPDVVDTLVHELLHRRYPKWKEPYVVARTTEICRAMTHDERHTLYKLYQKVKRQRVRRKKVK